MTLCSETGLFLRLLSRLRRILLGHGLALALLFNPGLPLQAQEIEGISGERIALNLSEARFIRLDRPAKTVFLSNPAVADIDLQSARHLYIVSRSVGESDLFVLGEDDREILSGRLSVRIDTAMLNAAVRRAVPGSAITVGTVGGAIFLSGTVPRIEDAAAAEEVVASLAGQAAIIVNRLEPANLAQVNLQVRIAEVSRSISEDLGIRLSGHAGRGNRNTFAAPQTGINSPFVLSLSNRSGSINMVLDALARNGLVSILSEPNLTTRSGQKATFLAGGRIPYIYGTGEDTSMQMEAIGVELEFTPTVRADNRIEIALTTRVRDIDPNYSFNENAPALTERSATTTVDLQSGQSFTIAGMLRSDSKQAISGLPGLARVPVLGALFRSSRYARGETELVVIVTPYLIAPQRGRPEDPASQIVPVDSGIEQMVTGRFTRPLRNGELPGQRQRAGGFMLQ